MFLSFFLSFALSFALSPLYNLCAWLCINFWESTFFFFPIAVINYFDIFFLCRDANHRWHSHAPRMDTEMTSYLRISLHRGEGSRGKTLGRQTSVSAQLRVRCCRGSFILGHARRWVGQSGSEWLSKWMSEWVKWWVSELESGWVSWSVSIFMSEWAIFGPWKYYRCPSVTCLWNAVSCFACHALLASLA